MKGELLDSDSGEGQLAMGQRTRHLKLFGGQDGGSKGYRGQGLQYRHKTWTDLTPGI